MRRPVAVAVLAALAAALVVAAAALSAGSSGASDTITACVKKSSGAARIVRAGTRCKRGERRVSWKRIGLAGRRGAQGATGAQGLQGQQGTQGMTGEPGIDAFNDLDGMSCTRGSDEGTVDIVFGMGGVALFVIGFLAGILALVLRFGYGIGLRPLLNLVEIMVISGIVLFGFGLLGEIIAGLQEETRAHARALARLDKLDLRD